MLCGRCFGDTPRLECSKGKVTTGHHPRQSASEQGSVPAGSRGLAGRGRAVLEAIESALFTASIPCQVGAGGSKKPSLASIYHHK